MCLAQGHNAVTLVIRSFGIGNKHLNSFEDGAICVVIQTYIAKKEKIQGWDTVPLNLFIMICL